MHTKHRSNIAPEIQISLFWEKQLIALPEQGIPNFAAGVHSSGIKMLFTLLGFNSKIHSNISQKMIKNKQIVYMRVLTQTAN